MNWPNRLSILQILCVPLLTVLFLFNEPWCVWAAVAVFALGSLTDFLDGHLARKNQWVTVFGKFIDPVADKLLVLSAFVMLCSLGLMPAWMAILILARELSVDGLRMVAVSAGKVIAAGPLGKIKTASQMALILLLLVLRTPVFSSWLCGIVGVWVCVITLWSGADYFIRHQDILS